MSEETHLRLLKILHKEPTITQRELAERIGVSLGKINYCLQALIEKGFVKANNFKNNKNKAAYAYLLTPRGIEEKSRITMAFLKRKMAEYEALRLEIDQLRSEVSATSKDETVE